MLVDELYTLSERTLAECVIRQSNIEGFSNPKFYIGLLKNHVKLGESKMLPNLNKNMETSLYRSFGFNDETTKKIIIKFLKKLLI